MPRRMRQPHSLAGRVGASVWRPVASAVAPFAALVVGCGSTDLDVVERLPAPQVQGTGDPPIAAPNEDDDVGSVDLPLADAGPECGSALVPLNHYRFRSHADGRCLSVGPYRLIGGFNGYDTEMADCEAVGATWQLIESTLGSFEVRNVQTDFALDVEYGNIEAGTPLVLFAPHGRENQKFLLNSQSDDSFAVSSAAQASLCIQSDAAGIVLGVCVAGESTQTWYVDTENCPPSEGAAP